jgi:hypothetical protein
MLASIYLQIADFISSNVEGVQLSSDAAAPRGDPFTSGGRYVPGSQSAPSNPAAPAARGDPFTSGGRYVPGGQPAASNGAATGSASHPFLSPNAYSSAGVDRTTSTGPKLIPKVRGVYSGWRPTGVLTFLPLADRLYLHPNGKSPGRAYQIYAAERRH